MKRHGKRKEKRENGRNAKHSGEKLQITLMLPSQKIKLLIENRETFLNQNKLAHLPLPHTRSPPEIFTTKFMAQRGAMVECPSLL